MNKRDVQELFALISSCKNNKKSKYGKCFDSQIENRCQEFCCTHNINITHGSAYNELRHKYYYYFSRYIKELVDNGTDKWELFSSKTIKAEEIVEAILKKSDK